MTVLEAVVATAPGNTAHLLRHAEGNSYYSRCATTLGRWFVIEVGDTTVMRTTRGDELAFLGWCGDVAAESFGRLCGHCLNDVRREIAELTRIMEHEHAPTPAVSSEPLRAG